MLVYIFYQNLFVGYHNYIFFTAKKEEKGSDEPEIVSQPADTKRESIKKKLTETQKGTETSKKAAEVTNKAVELTADATQKTIVVTQKSATVSQNTLQLTKKSVEATKESVEVAKKATEVSKGTATSEVSHTTKESLAPRLLSKSSESKEEKVEATNKKQNYRPTTLGTPSQNKVFEEVVSKPKAKVESSSSSSESTLRQSSFVLQTSTTTTSEAETLKQVQTPESETIDTGLHYKKIQAVEPLVQINKPRVLEEVVPYVIKPPPELVPGSAIDKVLAVEKRSSSETVLTDFQVGVGIEVNVEVGTDMSRRYTSSAG